MKYLVHFLSFMEFSNFSFDCETNERTWNSDVYADMLVYFRDIYNAYADFEKCSWSDNQANNLAKSAFLSETGGEFVSKALVIAVCELIRGGDTGSFFRGAPWHRTPGLNLSWKMLSLGSPSVFGGLSAYSI